ncbi:CsgG/HfaB family protein [Paraburkholderia humisilvae]|uniref:Curli production assembly/transport component CsgG n=2 Tax=Paraburkholderia humisilvae TaxID=627669 RepID=A0A6J5ELD5_9BURK|nr:hypothetical protein LMG29542_05507 [Paraburkholderia humisilvae]
MLAACAAPTTDVNMQFAAKSDAAQYRRVAVLPFDGDGGLEATRDFESMLASVQYEGKPYFKVVDSTTLQNVLNQQSLRQSALSSQPNAAKVGKLLGVDALYSGTALVMPTALSYSTESRVVCPDKKGGKCHDIKVPCTTRSVGFKLVPRLVEVSRGQVVYSEAKVGSASSYWCADSGAEISEQILLRDAVNDAFGQVREDVAPYEKAISVRYKTDDAAVNPASRDTFKGALEFAKAGRFDRACTIWSQLAPANPASLSVAYDLAVCEEVNGRLANALARYQQIDQRLTKPDDDVNASLARVTNALAQRSALKADAGKGSQRKPANPVSVQ